MPLCLGPWDYTDWTACTVTVPLLSLRPPVPGRAPGVQCCPVFPRFVQCQCQHVRGSSSSSSSFLAQGCESIGPTGLCLHSLLHHRRKFLAPTGVNAALCSNPSTDWSHLVHSYSFACYSLSPLVLHEAEIGLGLIWSSLMYIFKGFSLPLASNSSLISLASPSPTCTV